MVFIGLVVSVMKAVGETAMKDVAAMEEVAEEVGSTMISSETRFNLNIEIA